MKRILIHALRTRFAKALSANLYNQVVQLGLQLGSVPILAAHWGLRNYGVWLLLFTIPSYLAMADLGFATAAGNDMTMRAVRGDTSGAASVFLALKMIVVGVAALLLLAAAGFLVLFPHAADFAQQATGGRGRSIVLILFSYGLVALMSGVPMAGFRTIQAYALGGYMWVTMLLTEAVVALACVVRGGDLFEAALAYLAVRSIGGLILVLVLRARAPELFERDWRAAAGRIQLLMKPAFGAMALPGAQAIAIQGAVVSIGAAAGPAAVPLFTTVRTLTRTALQLTSIANVAAMPLFTVASATQDRRRVSQLVLLCLLTSAVLLLPAAPVLLVGGSTIVSLWTHGTVHPPFLLVMLMTMAMLLNGVWVPLSNFILAINRHGSFTYYYLLASALCLLFSYPLARTFGPEGVALALVSIDLLMVRRILPLAKACGVLNIAAMREELVRLVEIAKHRGREAPHGL